MLSAFIKPFSRLVRTEATENDHKGLNLAFFVKAGTPS